MREKLELRKIRCLDGLHYSFELLRYFYQRLHTTCREIPVDNEKVVPALACCWGFVDALHRIREIAQSIPDLSAKHQEMRAFLDATALAEDYRDYIQHLRSELAKDPPNTFPVWGSLSWVEEGNPNRSHIAILGAQIDGTTYTGCVYDTVEKKWVSKVCLGVDQRSFNFDPIYKACMRFKDFVLPYLVDDASDNVKFHDKLPIITMGIGVSVMPNNQLNEEASR